LASMLLQAGRNEDALRHYEIAVRLFPSNACWQVRVARRAGWRRGATHGVAPACAQVDLGHLYRLSNRIADAKACFLAAIREAPTFAIAWSNLACINKVPCMRMGVVRGGGGMRRRPAADTATAIRGRLQDERDINAAITHYRKAIALDPAFVDAYSNLGEAAAPLPHIWSCAPRSLA
jgi:tetratricopeptide (TPR) repeat protein